MSSKPRKTIALELVKSLLVYEPETGKFLWAADAPHQRRGLEAGNVGNQGYRRIVIGRRIYAAHRLAWLLTHGEMPSQEIDHINGNRDDNRAVNLRQADRCINTQNVGRRVDNRSGFAGVSFYRPAKKWKAAIKSQGKTHHLGYFGVPEEAHRAYMEAKAVMHPGFARAILAEAGIKEKTNG